MNIPRDHSRVVAMWFWFGFAEKSSKPLRMTTPLDPSLPVTDALPTLLDALATSARAVLVAPPGAGKTSLVPLALADAPWATGKILMLEPRRLAARAAAHRMAALTGSEVGTFAGYRIRGEAVTSATTRIEVVTEGILTRMIQADPALIGVSAVIFDEFHERSLHADLGLALAWEARGALRPDLRIVVMSATLDAAPIAALMDDAPVIRSEGRSFPVETIWLPRPRTDRLEDGVARLIADAHDAAPGDILVFLPGVPEIRRVAALLGTLPATTIVSPLYGTMAFRDQQRALAAPLQGQRKVVLSTAIAETSLTVEGVRIVVDAGLARRSRFDPGAGMSRLVTERASKAEATQRQGRAGRVAPGHCFRLWTRAEEGAMPDFAPAEIEITDLAGLALDLAAWGARPGDLAFLTPPPSGPLSAAQDLLRGLDALDAQGRITAHGRAIAAMPLHPRLAHMILSAPPDQRGAAVALAAMIEARDPVPTRTADLRDRLAIIATPPRAGAAEGAVRRIRDEAQLLGKRVGTSPDWRIADPGPLIARAYPDRIAQARPGNGGRYLLSGGKGAVLDQGDSLGGADYLAVADLGPARGSGIQPDAAIRAAAPLSHSDIETLFAAHIEQRQVCFWSRRDRRVLARRQRCFQALVLEDHAWDTAPDDAIRAAMLDGVRQLGLAALPFTAAATRLCARVEWARARGATCRSLSDAALLATLEDWLAPHLGTCQRAEHLAQLDLQMILQAHIGWDGMQEVNRIAPEAFTAPTGTTCRIDYGGAAPSIAIRLQELFGLTTHPQAGGVPLVIELLSPAARPVQTTADLPGFWRSSYADVRKDMRGRYPRHPWPEDPAHAEPTRRVKPRS